MKWGRQPLKDMELSMAEMLEVPDKTQWWNGTARFKNVNNCLNTNICSYLETSGGQGSNVYLNDVHFFNTSFIYVSFTDFEIL